MATKKITELTNLATPVGADILPIVDDVAGTATTKKVTATNLMTLAPVQSVNGSTGAVTLTTNLFSDTVADTTTSRTLSDSDNGKVILMTNVASITVTLPSTLSDGFNCKLVQGGAGQITVVAGASVTLYGYNSFTTTAGQYAVLNIIPVASDAYAIEGDITTTPFSNSLGASFDGTDDQITAAMGNLSVGSLSVWIKPSADITASLNGDEVVVGSDLSARIIGLGAITGYLTNEVICAAYSDGTNVGAFGYVGSGITISSSSWNHIFMSWQTSSETNSGSAGYDFWLNGTKATGSNAATGNAYGSPPASPATLATLYIGQRGNGSEYFDGLIDEMAIWTGDVSADVSTIYNSGASDDLESSSVVSTAPNVWYRFGDVTGDTASGGGTPSNGNAIQDIKNKINTSTYAATASGPTYTNDTP